MMSGYNKYDCIRYKQINIKNISSYYTVSILDDNQLIIQQFKYKDNSINGMIELMEKVMFDIQHLGRDVKYYSYQVKELIIYLRYNKDYYDF